MNQPTDPTDAKARIQRLHSELLYCFNIKDLAALRDEALRLVQDYDDASQAAVINQDEAEELRQENRRLAARVEELEKQC